MSTNVGENNLAACKSYVESTAECGEYFDYAFHAGGWCDCVPEGQTCSQAALSRPCQSHVPLSPWLLLMWGGGIECAQFRSLQWRHRPG